LGGSRQAGQLGQEYWDEQFSTSESYTINDVTFPSQIIDLNDQILEQTFGHSLKHNDDVRPLVGYRYIRSTENGLRLESETLGSKKIYHNYGHGGAGVTLSWGCAMQLTSKIQSQEISEIQSRIIAKLK
jgi:hypothetical protein